MMPTAAQAYLQALVAQHPLPTLPELSEEEKRAMLKDLGSLANAYDMPLDLSARVPRLLDELHDSLPPSAQQFLSDGQLVVGEIGIGTPNAHVLEIEKNQFVIVLHSGLFTFLYRIARPLASAVFRVKEVNSATGIGVPELARVIAEIFWWMQKNGDSFGPEYAITVEQKKLANVLAMRAERFLLAHEIGHVLFAMTKASSTEFAEQLDESMEEHVADVTALKATLIK